MWWCCWEIFWVILDADERWIERNFSDEFRYVPASLYTYSSLWRESLEFHAFSFDDYEVSELILIFCSKWDVDIFRIDRNFSNNFLRFDSIPKLISDFFLFDNENFDEQEAWNRKLEYFENRFDPCNCWCLMFKLLILSIVTVTSSIQ